MKRTQICSVGANLRQSPHDPCIAAVFLEQDPKRLFDRVQLSFRAKNLLDPDVRQTQGDRTVQTYKKGRYFGASVSVDLD